MTGYGPPDRDAARPQHPSDEFERPPSRPRRGLSPWLVGLLGVAAFVVVVALFVSHVL